MCGEWWGIKRIGLEWRLRANEAKKLRRTAQSGSPVRICAVARLAAARSAKIVVFIAIDWV